MLDLKQLEKQLDKALAKETSETLCAWLKVQRDKRSIFVFGSNTEGRHGKGAALEAKINHGAIYGQSKGLQGDSYGIVTKDLSKGLRSVSIDYIKQQIDELIEFAKSQPDWIFNVSPIGCGLAGFKPEEIAPLFINKSDNIILPIEFQI